MSSRPCCLVSSRERSKLLVCNTGGADGQRNRGKEERHTGRRVALPRVSRFISKPFLVEWLLMEGGNVLSASNRVAALCFKRAATPTIVVYEAHSRSFTRVTSGEVRHTSVQRRLPLLRPRKLDSIPLHTV